MFRGHGAAPPRSGDATRSTSANGSRTAARSGLMTDGQGGSCPRRRMCAAPGWISRGGSRPTTPMQRPAARERTACRTQHRQRSLQTLDRRTAWCRTAAEPPGVAARHVPRRGRDQRRNSDAICAGRSGAIRTSPSWRTIRPSPWRRGALARHLARIGLGASSADTDAAKIASGGSPCVPSSARPGRSRVRP